MGNFEGFSNIVLVIGQELPGFSLFSSGLRTLSKRSDIALEMSAAHRDLVDRQFEIASPANDYAALRTIMATWKGPQIPSLDLQLRDVRTFRFRASQFLS